MEFVASQWVIHFSCPPHPSQSPPPPPLPLSRLPLPPPMPPLLPLVLLSQPPPRCLAQRVSGLRRHCNTTAVLIVMNVRSLPFNHCKWVNCLSKDRRDLCEEEYCNDGDVQWGPRDDRRQISTLKTNMI